METCHRGRSKTWLDVIRNFTPAWFSVIMGKCKVIRVFQLPQPRTGSDRFYLPSHPTVAPSKAGLLFFFDELKSSKSSDSIGIVENNI